MDEYFEIKRVMGQGCVMSFGKGDVKEGIETER